MLTVRSEIEPYRVFLENNECGPTKKQSSSLAGRYNRFRTSFSRSEGLPPAPGESLLRNSCKPRPVGDTDRSLARSAWESVPKKKPSRRARYDRAHAP